MNAPKAADTSPWPRFIALLIAALLACLLPTPAKADKVAVVQRTTDDGLNQSQVRSILQDDQGFLWLGTHVGGVDRFDGLTFTHHTVRQGLPSNLVIDIAEVDGLILLGTRLGLALESGQGRFDALPLPEGFEDPQVNDLEADGQGGVWVATYSGLFYWTKGGLKPAEGISPQTIWAVSKDSAGTLWVSAEEGLFSGAPGGPLKRHPQSEALGRVRKIQADAQGGVWLATRSELYVSQEGDISPVPLPALPPGTSITALYADPSGGSAWVGSPLGATSATFEGQASHLGPKEGLPDAMVIAIHRDREGTLHLGTNGAGLVSLPPTPFVTFSRSPLEVYAPSQPHWHLRGDAPPVLWIPTLDQGLWRYDPLRFTPMERIAALGDKGVIFVHPEGGGGLWIGHFSGLSLLKEGRVTHAQGLPEGQERATFLSALTLDGAGTFFASSKGLLRYKEGRFEAFGPQGKDAPGEPLSLHGAKDGSIWLGTQDGGALQLDAKTGETLRHLKAGEGLPSSSVTAIGEDDNGVLYFGTDMGVAVLGPEGPRATITGDEGLPEGYIAFIIPEPREPGAQRPSKEEGDAAQLPLWIGTMGGLARYDGGKARIFAKAQGLPSGEANTSAAAMDPEGRLWFGMEGGYGVYDPTSVGPEPVPDTLIIRTRVGSEEVKQGGVLELEYDRNNLRWEFIAPTFVDPASVTYLTRLIGARDNWEEVKGRQAYYPTLEPGTYTFEVKACLGGRCDETPARSSIIVIRPPWYKTPGAMVLFVIAVFMAGFGVTYTRYIRQRARARNLERQVKLRTAELVDEQERSEALLLNILPAPILEELKAQDEVQPRRFGDVTILFTDLQGFTQAASNVGPERLVEELNEIFATFDEITQRHGLEKLKTIGDAYMAVGGLPVENTTHTEDAIRVGLEMQAFMESRLSLPDTMPFRLRVGIHTGPVVAAVIGTWKYAYDIWGDSVNVASRMESGGEVGRVNISKGTFERVKGQFRCTPRGAVQVKGKGALEMFFVEEELNNEAP